jgi:hypothetical protein
VTFALRPVEAERLIFAASFAEEVRLALLRPGEESQQLADEACGPLKFRSRTPKRKAQTED